MLSVGLAATGKATKRAGTQIHGGLSDLSDLYDAFILDQFGVLHNGVSALPGAIECVEYLAKKSKKMVILSNTSAPAKKALEKLPKLGFPPAFVAAVTSGEEASKYVLNQFGSDGVTKRALFFTWDMYKPGNPRLTAPPQAFLDQCGNVKVAKSVDDADFVLLHGSEILYTGGTTLAEAQDLKFTDNGSFCVVDPILEACQERGLPLVCANPDIIVQTPEGGVAYMPGKIANRYKELGGECMMFGKPAPQHFRACLEALGDDVDPTRVVHVGDSLHHDIGGANAAGIDSIFVASGIHKDDLRISFGEDPSEEALCRLFLAQDVEPTHVVSTFATS